MAEEKSLTPERELLKLIEEPGTKVGVSPTRPRTIFSPVAIKARLSFLKAKFKGSFSFQRLVRLEIKNVNRFLEICIFILIFYLIVNFVISVINSNKKSNLSFEVKKIIASSVLPETSFLKSISYYLERARARDIFKMGLVASKEDKKQITEVPVSVVAEAAKTLKLVGISWSDDPDVIIEDTKQERAYFLKRGQTINDFKIKAIFKDKVILSYRGEEIELK